MSQGVPLYDALGDRYDVLIDWQARLARETPFFQELFEHYGVRTVLDAACGTGRHVELFTDWGLDVVGADPSVEMIRAARARAGDRDVARFVRAGFGKLCRDAGRNYDAVVCLGNSLPHLLTREEISQALADMSEATSTRSGGLVIVHNNNYDRILARRERFMPLASGHRDGREYLFVRFFDFGEELLTFNVTTLMRDAEGWHLQVDSTRHYPLRADELETLMAEAGLKVVERWGSFQKEPFIATESDNLILVAVRETG